MALTELQLTIKFIFVSTIFARHAPFYTRTSRLKLANCLCLHSKNHN